MAKAVLAALLCVAGCALLTLALAAATRSDAVVVGLIVSATAVVPLCWFDHHRAAGRELTYEDDARR